MKCPKCGDTGVLIGGDTEVVVGVGSSPGVRIIGKAWVGTCVVCGDTYAKIDIDKQKAVDEILNLTGYTRSEPTPNGFLTKVRSRVDTLLSQVSPFPGAPDKEGTL